MIDTKLYEDLGVSPDATQDEIKKAFRKKAKQLHPDHHAGDLDKQEKFKDITVAYSVLSDPEARRKYDTSGSTVNVEQHVKQEALSVIIQELSSIFVSSGDAVFKIDLFKRATDSLTERGRKECHQIKMIKQQAKRLDKLLSKIKHQSGTDSFVHQAFTAERNKMLMSIQTNKLKIRVYWTAKKIIKEYEFMKEKEEFMPGYQIAQSPFFKIMNTTGGSGW